MSVQNLLLFNDLAISLIASIVSQRGVRVLTFVYIDWYPSRTKNISLHIFGLLTLLAGRPALNKKLLQSNP